MKKKGISLIVLVITIIVIIILATAVIVTFVQNNPIENAKGATKKWNEKVLQEKADLFELDLLAEFQQQGLGSMILPEHAKEAYKNAIKEGKTEDEARNIGKESFVPPTSHWVAYGSPSEIVPYKEALHYSPLYNEVNRVVDLLWADADGVIDLNIDESIVPEDMVNSIKAEQNMMIENIKGNVTDEEYNAFWDTNEPLRSFIELDPNGKYYNQMADPLYVPYFMYRWTGSKYVLSKVGDITNRRYNDQWAEAKFRYVGTLTVDPNYTQLVAGIIPPVSGECNIVLPDTLKVIKNQAFVYSGVKTLVIPSGVDVIEEFAFTRLKADRYSITNRK